jgi:hypothetical protein
VSPAQRRGKGRSTPRKAQPSKAPAPQPRFGTAHRVALIVLALAVVLTTAGYAVFRGLGNPSIPSNAVAVVQDAPNGTVTKAEFTAALPRELVNLQLPKLPKPGTPQYTTLQQSAMSDLLLERWIEGEAQERGIEVSPTLVQDKLASIIKSQFSNNVQQFNSFLVQSHFTNQQNCFQSATQSPPPACGAEALKRVQLQLLSTRLQNEVLPTTTPNVSDAAITNYYDSNLSQFNVPATRDVRLVLNKDKAQVEKAKAALDSDDSATNWKKVAKQFSTDPTTKANGGLRQAVAKGQSEPALDKALFAAAPHQIIGPIKGSQGYYVIEVEAIHPATTTPLAKVRPQIQQQLSAQLQSAITNNFQTDFTDKWTSRTFCASAQVMSRCSNYVPPSTCPQATAEKTGCGAPVPAIKPVPPGHATVFFTIPAEPPQGPIEPAPKGGTGIPGGTPIPLGPGGAPPAGAVPGQ